MKHNYPKNRRKGIKKNSQKHRLLAKYPLVHIQKIWIEFGMYEGARRLGYSNPFVLYHLARNQKWRRKLPDFLVKAYNEGSWCLTERYYIDKKGE